MLMRGLFELITISMSRSISKSMPFPLDEEEASDPAYSDAEFRRLSRLISRLKSVLFELCPVCAALLHPIEGEDIPLRTGDSDMRSDSTLL